MPEEYQGREQTWLKHRVLAEYLAAWAHKLGSTSDHLWFVDCFAGPWESQHSNLDDTSIAIGLRALNDAAETWRRQKSRSIQLHAVFVEKNPRSYEALRSFLNDRRGVVDVHTFPGAFGEHVNRIDRLIGDHPAFIFIDPTGWDGVDLRFVAELAAPRHRDVLVNVMYEFINRFKDDEREFLRRQMREFFGITDDVLPPGLSETELMRFYRDRLRKWSGLPLVADLAVPMSAKDRTYFRLVVGGHHRAVVELFRDVERKVIGGDAALVRAAAKARLDEKRTNQRSLFPPSPRPVDPVYADQRTDAMATVQKTLPAWLTSAGPTAFGDLWPALLCEHHLTVSDLKEMVHTLHKQGVIELRGFGPRERSVKDHHIVALRPRSSSSP